jgi:hypothetical protein
MRLRQSAIALVMTLATSSLAAAQVSLTPIGTVRTGLFRSEDPRNAEINAYDPVGKRIYVGIAARKALLSCNNTNDCGDLGPEGLTFVSAVQSPTGNALLIVSNEVSSTTTIWEVK